MHPRQKKHLLLVLGWLNCTTKSKLCLSCLLPKIQISNVYLKRSSALLIIDSIDLGLFDRRQGGRSELRLWRYAQHRWYKGAKSEIPTAIETAIWDLQKPFSVAKVWFTLSLATVVYLRRRGCTGWDALPLMAFKPLWI